MTIAEAKDSDSRFEILLLGLVANPPRHVILFQHYGGADNRVLGAHVHNHDDPR